MVERNLRVNPTTVWRWVQRYAPELHRRVRRELRRMGTSWRVDEICVWVAGRWVYRSGPWTPVATLDFHLSERCDAAAKRFFDKILVAPNHPRPRVINVDGNPRTPTR